MRRQRSQPWIHRYSRPITAGIASIGAAITAYLTVVKLSNGTAVCPIEGCDIVLSSPYAYVFGLPLSLFGFLGYLSMIVFAVAPLLVNPVEQKSLRSKLESWTGLFLFAGSTAMTIFSGYLMYVLAVDIKAACIYCIA
ncbi:vitamin K epoxide reductase family protein, partial [Microcoleus sp. AT8-B6]|uniref:vitamin K epoxide reductase family protein n=1 Tax=Microcoleus sp. AT8-B6 TaxID=2818622 RepID=UPI002FD0A5E6